MIKFTSETKGDFRGLMVRLKGLGNDLEKPMRESLEVLRQEASRFPAQPSRTRAKTFNTWIREKGRMSISAFRTSKGKAKKKPSGGRVLVPSQQMLKRWKAAPVKLSNGTGQIVNTATYAPFVQGEQRTSFHKQTGWKTTREILAIHAKRIRDIFKRYMTK